MPEFAPDEGLFFPAALAAGGSLAARYYAPLVTVWRVPPRYRATLATWPIICFAPIVMVLNTVADPQVRGHPDYTLLFLAGGLVWVFAPPALPLMTAVHFRRDVLERAHPATVIVTASAMLASGGCYAAANAGTGPTLWTTVLPAMLAVAGVTFAAIVIHLSTPVADAIAIDRHLPSALVLSAFLIVATLIMAQAAAGDFLGWVSTLRDFARAACWLMLPTAIAVLVLWIVRPRTGKGGIN